MKTPSVPGSIALSLFRRAPTPVQLFPPRCLLGSRDPALLQTLSCRLDCVHSRRVRIFPHTHAYLHCSIRLSRAKRDLTWSHINSARWRASDCHVTTDCTIMSVFKWSLIIIIIIIVIIIYRVFCERGIWKTFADVAVYC